MKREEWYCETCKEYKASMHGNPDSGLCLECYEEATVAAVFGAAADRLDDLAAAKTEEKP